MISYPASVRPDKAKLTVAKRKVVSVRNCEPRGHEMRDTLGRYLIDGTHMSWGGSITARSYDFTLVFGAA